MHEKITQKLKELMNSLESIRYTLNKDQESGTYKKGMEQSKELLEKCMKIMYEDIFPSMHHLPIAHEGLQKLQEVYPKLIEIHVTLTKKYYAAFMIEEIERHESQCKECSNG